MQVTGVRELVELLSAGPKPVADVLAAVPESAIDLAWSGGLIEFGKLPCVVTGRPEFDVSQSSFILESTDPAALEWSGQKTAAHAPFAKLLTDSKDLPTVGRYLTYKLLADENGEVANEKVPITPDEAKAGLALHVRLTNVAAQETAKAIVRQALGVPVEA